MDFVRIAEHISRPSDMSEHIQGSGNIFRIRKIIHIRCQKVVIRGEFEYFFRVLFINFLLLGEDGID